MSEFFNETTAVFVDDGGYEDPSAGYDEKRCWFVTPGDDDGEPTGKSTTFYSADAAFNFARAESERLGVELVTA